MLSVVNFKLDLSQHAVYFINYCPIYNTIDDKQEMLDGEPALLLRWLRRKHAVSLFSIRLW